MASDELKDRLQSLSKILGKRVDLTESPPQKQDSESLTNENVNTAVDESLKLVHRPAQMGEKSTGKMAASPQNVLEVNKPSATSNAPKKKSTPQAVPIYRPFDCSNFYAGQSQNENFEFCPWSVVTTYPDFFIGKANKPRAQPFFSNILQNRVWDFFCIHDVRKPSEKPHLLVPTGQFLAFLDVINKSLDTSLTIPFGMNEDRFSMRFFGDAPRPRYLMRNRDTKTLDIESWPRLNDKDIAAYRKASGIRQQDYEEHMDLMWKQPGKDKSKTASLRAARKKEHGERMLQEVQLFLGLGGKKAGSDVLFVCFDAEALEQKPNPVSEIGIAILDVQDIHNVESGPCGRDWWPMIKAHHLRTKEYSGLVNYRYVQGCPDKFDFGTSTFPKKAELPLAVMSILQPYIDSSRNIVLVGHDFAQEVKFLSGVGLELLHLPNLLTQADSQDVHKIWRDSNQGRSLKSVLADLYIPNKNLHNAGNDAVFTLRALVGVAIESTREAEADKNGEEYVPALRDI